MNRWRYLRDNLVAPVVVIGFAAALVVVAAHSVDRSGYERGVQAAKADWPPLLAREFGKGYEAGRTDGVARVLGGVPMDPYLPVKSNDVTAADRVPKCAVTSNVRRTLRPEHQGRAAPPRDCILIDHGGPSYALVVFGWLDKPEPVPTPQAEQR